MLSTTILSSSEIAIYVVTVNRDCFNTQIQCPLKYKLIYIQLMLALHNASCIHRIYSSNYSHLCPMSMGRTSASPPHRTKWCCVVFPWTYESISLSWTRASKSVDRGGLRWEWDVALCPEIRYIWKCCCIRVDVSQIYCSGIFVLVVGKSKLRILSNNLSLPIPLNWIGADLWWIIFQDVFVHFSDPYW